LNHTKIIFYKIVYLKKISSRFNNISTTTTPNIIDLNGQTSAEGHTLLDYITNSGSLFRIPLLFVFRIYID